jgi:hypothetical protein
MTTALCIVLFLHVIDLLEPENPSGIPLRSLIVTITVRARKVASSTKC